MKLPSNANCSLAMFPPNRGAVVIIAASPTPPTLDALADQVAQGRGLSAHISHDPGLSWPDAAGQRLVEEVLARCGIAVLTFASMGDALRAHRRVLETLKAAR
jgi:hypothetical protein